MKRINIILTLFAGVFILTNVLVSAQTPVSCDMTLKSTIQGFKVYKHNPSGAIMFKAKMAIDADGSPRAYGPSNSGLDYTANAGSPGNWWGVVTNSNGNPIIQGSGNPYPGMYVSTTSLVNTSSPSTNPAHYVNSEVVPFFVLPSAVTSLGNIHLGDIGYVYNTVTGLGCYAVFADGGPAGKLGEASIYLASQIGVNSNARTGGTSSGIIDYIVFPGSGSGQGSIPTIAQINSIGTTQINAVGGTGITDCLSTISCGTPSGLTVNSITTSSATLNWSVVSGANSYNVQYKPLSSSTWTTVSTTTASNSISGLSSSTSYQFQVQAICSSAGSYSSLANFSTTASSSTCGTPTALVANSITSTSATLNWGAVSGANSYNIQYKTTTGSSWISVTSSTTSTSISGLSPTTSYDFQVQAVCTSTGSFSSLATFTTISSSGSNDNCANSQTLIPNTTCVSTSGTIAGATAGGLPKASCDGYSGTPALKDVWYNFQATASSSTIKITPSSSFDAVLALYTSCSGGQIGCADNGGGPGAAETINATNLTVGTTYYVRVYSYGATTPSTPTFTICVTAASTASCGTPTGLSANSITATSATVNWNSVSGANSYNIQYKAVSSSIWTTVTSSSTSQIINGLNASTAYHFQVQAVCSNTGNYSSPVAFTTLASTSTTSTITVGTGTSAYSAHPFGTIYMDERTQYIITKAELSSAGWSSVSPFLKSMAFNVTNAASQPMGNFTITIEHVAASTFSSTTFLSGSNSTIVYSGTIAAVSGWNTYNFTTPFAYNGTSNLLVSICWNNSSFTANSSVQSYSYSNYVALYYRADVSGGGVCAQGSGTRSYYRPNTKLVFSSAPGMMPYEGEIDEVRTIAQEVSPVSIASEPVFEIYPNPLEGTILYGKFSGDDSKKMVLKIYDLLGRELISKEVNVEDGNFSLSFDDHNLGTGVYMVVGLSETKRFTKKLIVK